jgi:hypothetical protein
MKLALLAVFAIAGCGIDHVELFPGEDATVTLPDASQPAPDLQSPPDLRPACVCRYVCRLDTDCRSLTGGTTMCDQQQQQCTGVDPCTTNADCTASPMSPRCALASDSLSDCP